jgi:hypothetical protein
MNLPRPRASPLSTPKKMTENKQKRKRAPSTSAPDDNKSYNDNKSHDDADHSLKAMMKAMMMVPFSVGIFIPNHTQSSSISYTFLVPKDLFDECKLLSEHWSIDEGETPSADLTMGLYHSSTNKDEAKCFLELEKLLCNEACVPLFFHDESGCSFPGKTSEIHASTSYKLAKSYHFHLMTKCDERPKFSQRF